MKFLQLDFFRGLFPCPRSKTRKKRAFSEDANLKEIWSRLREEYFSSRIDLEDYCVTWSGRRQLRTLATCFVEEKRVRVAKELRYPEYDRWLSPLLFHEMCHAFLNQEKKRGKQRSSWHGKDFKALARKHPLSTELDKWIKTGGWLHAVRSHRAREAHHRRNLSKKAA